MSVGVFLVIVVSAAILIFRPGSGPVSAATVSSADSEPNRSVTINPSDIANGEAFRGLQDPASGSPIHENFIDNNGDAAAPGTVINVPKPNTAAVPDVKPIEKPAVAKDNPPQTKPPAVSEAAAPAPKKMHRDFWVQAGSFSTRERADGVKSTLGTKGISAIVTNQEINGNTYYRVRIGPYTSQNEADYWLAMVKSIDGFHDSQIWESQSFR